MNLFKRKKSCSCGDNCTMEAMKNTEIKKMKKV